MGESWWLWVWFAWMAFNLLILAVYPTFIAPLFNKFTPLARPEPARVASKQLLARTGFQIQRRVRHGRLAPLAAMATPISPAWAKNKRIVFFDTLLEQLSVRTRSRPCSPTNWATSSDRHIVKRIVLMFVL
jgi:STE24 endopeptidase